MKILVVCQYYHPEPFRITDICESLVNRGHEVSVLTGLPNYPKGVVLEDYRHRKNRKETIHGVKVLRSFVIGRGKSRVKLFFNYISFAVSATLKTLFMKEEFDVVLVNQLSPVIMGIPAIAYKKKHHKKLLFYCLDLWPDSLIAGGVKETSIIYKLFFQISKWIYKSADMILVTSSMFINYFKDTLNIDTCNIKHLPQYAEDLFIRNKKDDNDEQAKKDSTTYHFVFAGNIGDLQSVETIVKAANELRNQVNIIFHIVGDGSKLKKCKQLSRKLKLYNIVFWGRRPVSEMPYFYGMADAMLITLKNNKKLAYTLPGKIQSYMAAGKPIIGAINGETQRSIEAARCGFCCPAEDYRGLAKLVLGFIDRVDKEEMANNALSFYQRNYSKVSFLSVLEDALTNMFDCR